MRQWDRWGYAGAVGVTTVDFSLKASVGTSTDDKETNGNAGCGEGGFDNQLLLLNTNGVFTLGSWTSKPAMTRLGMINDLSFPSNSHAVQSELDATLSQHQTSSARAH